MVIDVEKTKLELEQAVNERNEPCFQLKNGDLDIQTDREE